MNNNKYDLLNFNDSVQIETDLENDLVRHLWRCEWSLERTKNYVEGWVNRSELIINNLDNLSNFKALFYMALELSCVFIQANFTGPPFENIYKYVSTLEPYAQRNYDPLIRLKKNTEEVNPNVKLGELLVIAKEMIDALIRKSPMTWVTLKWWKLRLLCLHQMILHELSQEIWSECEELISFLLEHSHSLQDLEMEALLHLECANAYLQFLRGQRAEQVLNGLCEKLRVSFSVEDLMCKWERDQEEPLPLACLKVVQQEPGSLPSAVLTNGSTILPNRIKLENDTFLDHILFANEADNAVMTLPSVLQALVLSTIKLKLSQYKHLTQDQQRERIAPYLRTLMYQVKGPWLIRQSALLINCMHEGDERTSKRNLGQCEEIYRMISEEPSYTFFERLSYGFVSGLQPRWQVEHQQFNILVSLNMMEEAFDLALYANSSEDAILCCERLGKRPSEELDIRTELSIRPTVVLHLMLADFTGSIDDYESAWRFSQHSALARAFYGHFWFKRAEYSKAIPCYNESLQLNNLQELVWLRLFLSAIQMKDWYLVENAYAEYLNLQPSVCESWNDIAQALRKIEDQNLAHEILTNAIRNKFDEWQAYHPLSPEYSKIILRELLEKFLDVSKKKKCFDDAMDAYSRLCRLENRHYDPNELYTILESILAYKVDAGGATEINLLRLFKDETLLEFTETNAADRERLNVLRRFNDLIDGLCRRYPNEWKFWDIAAKLSKKPLKTAEKLSMSYIAQIRNRTWPQYQQSAHRVLTCCYNVSLESLQATLDCRLEEREKILRQLRKALVLVTECIENAEGNVEEWSEVNSLLNSLRRQRELLKEKILNLKHPA